MDKKLILLDVDGTIISYAGNIPTSVYDACDKAHENGHIIVFVTGRTLGHVEEPFMKCKPDGIIGGNGAFIYYNNEILFEQTIPYNEVRKIVDYLDEQDMVYFVESVDAIYGSKDFANRCLPAYKKYGLTDFSIEKSYPLMQFPEDLAQDRVTKINYILRSYNDYLTIKDKFPNVKSMTWGGKGEEAIFGDCGVYGIDKSVSIQKLIDHLNIKKENTIAFGDAKVDIPMFELCHTSVSFEDSRIEAKEAATFVTDAVEDDGLFNAFKKLGLID